MRKALLKFFLWLIAAGLIYGTVKTVSRQMPRKMPTQPLALRSSVRSILSDKCALCHIRDEESPWFAKLPLLGEQIALEQSQAMRHWEPNDRSYLGPTATEGQKLDAPVPLSIPAKLERVLVDDSMPPLFYRAVCCGSWLSVSEKEILKTWNTGLRSDWLSDFGITNGQGNTIQPIPKSIAYNPAKAALGELLFRDTRLSASGEKSCATCHDLAKGGTSGLKTKADGCDIPTVFNSVFNIRQFWDGSKLDVAEVSLSAVLAPDFMGCTNWTQVTSALSLDETFRTNFLAVYPDGITEKNIASAIAEYAKTLLTPSSRFDQYLLGKKAALTTEEVKGYQLFRTHDCARCHNGPSLGGQSFEYADLKDDYFKGRLFSAIDHGLAAHSKLPRDERRFKVPSLRNVALTAPYMHDGAKATLPDAVASMFTFQLGMPYSESDVRLVVSFLKTLTGEYAGASLEKTK